MAGDEDKSLIWITIEDFTPGVITNSQMAFSTANNPPVPGTAPVPGNKTGQAQAAVGCIALPNGGLGPLPGLLTPIPPPVTPTTLGMINGLFTVGPLNGGDQIFYGQVTVDGSDNAILNLAHIVAGGSIIPDIIETVMTAAVPQTSTLTGDTTAVIETISGITAEVATLAIAYWNSGGTTVGYIWLYPDPTNASSDVPLTLTSSSVSGRDVFADVLTHQNRIVGLAARTVSWGSLSTVTANELFDYTDPPSSLSYGAQDETFIAEHPFGHGTWGSINASELFLVKHTGGGYFIEGDLNNPTVVHLPGVISTYGLMCRGVASTIGFVYASNNRGLWAWQGGSSSVKISEALEDDFFVNPGVEFTQLPIVHGPTVDCRQWGDWIVVTNDWLLDTNTGGWWQLPPGSDGTPHLFYAESSDSDTLYASLVVPTTHAAIDVYSHLRPTSTFSWTSYPMRLSQGSKDRNYVIEAVVIRVMGHGTVEVTLTGTGGSSNVGATAPSQTLSFDSPHQPVMLMVRTGLVAQDVTVNVVCTTFDLVNHGPAPVIYSIALGYFEQNPVSAT
jgi:hypothetical protein